KALAPITPFVTDKIYRELYNPDGIHKEQYPEANKEWKSDLVTKTDLLMKTNGGFWKYKRENNMSLRHGLAEAWISEELKPWARDLQAMHGIEKINFSKPEDEDAIEVQLPESEDVIFVKASVESKE
ncbi:hypothetical protein EU522_01130, partial [Candidatus Thorarchaeota archaeon]